METNNQNKENSEKKPKVVVVPVDSAEALRALGLKFSERPKDCHFIGDPPSSVPENVDFSDTKSVLTEFFEKCAEQANKIL